MQRFNTGLQIKKSINSGTQMKLPLMSAIKEELKYFSGGNWLRLRKIQLEKKLQHSKM